MKKLNRLYLGTNTKMYKTIAETTSFLTQLRRLTKTWQTAPPPVCHPLLYLPGVRQQDYIRIPHPAGAQNMCWEDQGQFTGEISPVMLKEVGVSVVEIGHSERRHVFRENDFDQEKRKRQKAAQSVSLSAGIGDPDPEGLRPKQGRPEHPVKGGASFHHHRTGGQLWIAYEPVWAIGVEQHPRGQ